MPRKKQTKNPFPLVLIVLGGTLVFAALIGIMLINQGASAGEIPASAIKRISLVEAKAAFDQKKAVFLDVRGSAVFAESHIPGARLIPSTEIETRFTELNQNDWIITYCT
jgi:hypothetical protein